MQFSNYSVLSRGIVLSFLYLSYGLLIFYIIFSWENRKGNKNFLISVVLLMITWIIICTLVDFNKRYFDGLEMPYLSEFVGNIPIVFYIALILADLHYFFAGMVEGVRLSKNKITTNSIKEAMDNFPNGLNFSDKKGVSLYTNKKMNFLSEKITGTFFRNIDEFWNGIKKLEKTSGIEYWSTKDIPILKLDDESVWKFEKNEVYIDNDIYSRIKATDISLLYKLTEELKEKNTSLDKHYIRLKKLLEEIVKSNLEEEILYSKIEVHRRFGECLLKTRRHLGLKKKDIDKNLVEDWKNVISFMEDGSKIQQDTFYSAMKELIDVGNDLGCKIIFKGESKNNISSYGFFKYVIREAMTNSIRHAQANELIVEISEDDKFLYLDISDNCKKEFLSIKEGTGLSNIRKKIEKENGILEIKCGKGVKLHIKVPVGDKNDTYANS